MSGQSKKLSAFSNKTIRLAVVTALCAGFVVGVAYWARRSSCETDERAITGEVKRVASGKLMYFDGRCWTTKPMPPTDTPF
jgi:hypothetical protein